ncbi:MAG: hypothetical protein ACTSO2_15055 [Promethearchaeota archaeon]
MTPIYIGTATNYTEVNRLPNIYYYAVIAGNSFKNTSLSINIIINVNYPIEKPKLSIDYLKQNIIRLNWNPVTNASCYLLYRSKQPIQSLNDPSLTLIYNGTMLYYEENSNDLQNGKYYYIIVASNGYVNSYNLENVVIIIDHLNWEKIISLLIGITIIGATLSIISYNKIYKKRQIDANIERKITTIATIETPIIYPNNIELTNDEQISEKSSIDPNTEFFIIDNEKEKILKQIGLSLQNIDLQDQKVRIAFFEIQKDAAIMSLEELKKMKEYITNELLF